MGRPNRFKSPQELQKKIDEYFAECDRTEILKTDDGVPVLSKGMPVYVKEQTPYTVGELALAIGFNSINAFSSYMARAVNREKECIADMQLIDEIEQNEYRTVLTRAVAKVQAFREKALFDKNTVNGARFALSCQDGWNEGKTVDVSIKNGNVASPEDAIKGLEALGFTIPKEAEAVKTNKNAKENE